MPFKSIIFKATPYHKNPCPGVHEIYNLGRSVPWSLSLYTPFVQYMPWSREEDF